MMRDEPPNLIDIECDDYHAKHVGRTANGMQFFLTTPFEPALKDAGAEFIALYLFDSAGKLIEARIDELGPRKTLDEAMARQLYDRRLAELGNVEFCRIRVAPFSINRFGSEFGLVLRDPDDDDDPWAVEAQPGNYMAFFEPWDSGEYDT